MSSELHTTEQRQLLARFQGGDSAALEELLRRAAHRLEHLARAMLHRYPLVRQREQTADVLQEAMLSLLGALRQLSFASTREFYGLAAEHIRRRLLDMTRQAQRDRAHIPLVEAAGEADRIPAQEEEELDLWQALHEAVAGLPAELREVFSLRFYHGWSNQEVADLLQVSRRTVIRLWMQAQLVLGERLGGWPVPGRDGPPAA